MELVDEVPALDLIGGVEVVVAEDAPEDASEAHAEGSHEGAGPEADGGVVEVGVAARAAQSSVSKLGPSGAVKCLRNDAVMLRLWTWRLMLAGSRRRAANSASRSEL